MSCRKQNWLPVSFEVTLNICVSGSVYIFLHGMHTSRYHFWVKKSKTKAPSPTKFMHKMRLIVRSVILPLLTYKMHLNISLHGRLPISWLSTPLKRNFLLIGNRQQLTKIQNTSLNTTHSALNLGFVFDEHLTLSDQISALAKSCYSHIRQLRCIRPYLDLKTASTIATSINHSKLDYCNSLYFNLPKSQINRLRLIQNSLARVVVKVPKSCHISPVPHLISALAQN